MSPRWLALVVLLAVLPTAEVVEQAVHVIEHVVAGEDPRHDAHHDESHGDEHGCTGLVHLCSCHRTQVTVGATIGVTRRISLAQTLSLDVPSSLVDLTTPDQLYRPPISAA